MGYRTGDAFAAGSNQGNPRLELTIPEAAAAFAAASPSRPRHFGASPRHARHARPLGGCRAFDLSDAFDRLDDSN